MPDILLSDLPDDLYERLRDLATDHNRSVSAEAACLFDRALRGIDPREAHAAAMAEIRRDRFSYPEGRPIPDSVELLREDRGR